MLKPEYASVAERIELGEEACFSMVRETRIAISDKANGTRKIVGLVGKRYYLTKQWV